MSCHGKWKKPKNPAQSTKGNDNISFIVIFSPAMMDKVLLVVEKPFFFS